MELYAKTDIIGNVGGIYGLLKFHYDPLKAHISSFIDVAHVWGTKGGHDASDTLKFVDSAVRLEIEIDYAVRKRKKKERRSDLDPRSCLGVISEMTNSVGKPYHWDLSSCCHRRRTRIDEKSNKSLFAERTHFTNVSSCTGKKHWPLLNITSLIAIFLSDNYNNFIDNVNLKKSDFFTYIINQF